MSVINRMLQELDRRGATPPGADGARGDTAVRAVPAPQRHEWFWRALAVLMVVSLGWTAWVAYELMWPRALVTPLAYEAAERARSRSGTVAPKPKAPPAVAAATPAPPSPPAVAPAPPPAPKPPPAPEAKPEPAPAPVAKAEKAPAPVAKADKPSPPKPAMEAKLPATTLRSLDVPPARVLPYQPRKVERRDREVPPNELAEREFRRGVELLKQGRASEAEQRFAVALAQDGLHRGARQALVALELERGRLDGARHLLEQGLALDRAQPEFAYTLARIHIERGDYAPALSVLDASVESASAFPDYHYLHGTVLQRLNRHADAAKAFRAALAAESGSPKAWIGLGISLEALKQRPEAAEAFRRALAAGPANEDLKVFAEQRLRALR